MRRSLCALLAVPAALAVATPALAAEDAFNSSGLRKAVTLQGVREHQQALQTIATASQNRRTSGTPGYDASVAYVANRLQAAGYDVTLPGVPVRLLREPGAAAVRPCQPERGGVRHAPESSRR